METRKQNDHSPPIKFFRLHYITTTTRLAVRRVGSKGNNTLVDKINVRPVLALSTLTIDLSSRVRNSSPESATSNVLVKSIALSIKESLAPSHGVVVHGLQTPLSNENRELGLLRKVLSLTAHSRVDILRVGACSGEVVDVRVKHNVGASVVEGCPVGSALETVLNHHGNALVDLGDLFEHTAVVSIDPVGGFVREAGRGTEAGEVVRGFVDGRDGKGRYAAAGLDEVQDAVDSLERVVEVGGVVEPAVVHQSLTDIEVVDTTGQGVETDDNVHIVLVDGIVGNSLEVLLLVAMVENGAGDFDPCGVGCRNTENVYTNRSQLVDGGSVQEGSVTSFEGRTALVSKIQAQSPLIRGIGTTNRLPPDRVVSLLLREPSTEIGTVCLEGLPVNEAAGLGEAEIVLIGFGDNRDLGKGERTPVFVVHVGTMVVTIGMEMNTERVQYMVEVIGEVPEDVADKTRSRRSDDTAGQKSGTEGSRELHV
jgi:hypothetical protein